MGAWPVDPGVLPAFLLAMAVVELTPGPNMAYLAVVSASRGRVAGLATICGVTAGLSAYLLLSLVLLSTAARLDARLLDGLRWAGVAYMVWLAVDAFRSTGVVAHADDTVRDTPTTRELARFAARGLVANLLNAKVAVFYLAIMPGFMRDGFGSVTTQAASLGALHIAISLAVHTAIVFGAAGLVSGLTARGRSLARLVLSLSLLLVAGWLALAL